jgi:hypothetical protein
MMRQCPFVGRMVRDFGTLPPPPTVCLNSKDLLVKLSLNKLLKIMKFLEDIRFIFKEIKLRKLAIIINERHIVFKFPNRRGSRTPYIRED